MYCLQAIAATGRRPPADARPAASRADQIMWGD
jgi:hypothetical protein